MNKLILSLIFIFSSNFFSHEFNPAHLLINETEELEYEALWMTPIKNLGTSPELSFPKICEIEKELPFRQGKYLSEKILLKCGESLRGKAIQVSGLSILNDALVTINHFDGDRFEGLMNLKVPEIIIPKDKQVYPTGYFYLGVEHLLGGVDHVVFVLGLIFLISGFIPLLKTVTAFTLAHSITLAISVLGVFKLPSASTEALIALTIIYLAFELTKTESQIKRPWLMAFGFGLLHGFGFAGALSEIGIANDQLFLSLLFFNIGIEIGQLMIIPLVGLVIYVLNFINLKNQFRMLITYGIGGMGVFWFVTRIWSIVN
ncbi:MAG: HupE/UreJ family protein [Gammaproteobacteria bacterium]|tara:strand:+ start:3692 stop:4639 length:948 start_codon:yes stop_codon:yes gene_type:complete